MQHLTVTFHTLPGMELLTAYSSWSVFYSFTSSGHSVLKTGHCWWSVICSSGWFWATSLNFLTVVSVYEQTTNIHYEWWCYLMLILFDFVCIAIFIVYCVILVVMLDTNYNWSQYVCELWNLAMMHVHRSGTLIAVDTVLMILVCASNEVHLLMSCCHFCQFIFHMFANIDAMKTLRFHMLKVKCWLFHAVAAMNWALSTISRFWWIFNVCFAIFCAVLCYILIYTMPDIVLVILVLSRFIHPLVT